MSEGISPGGLAQTLPRAFVEHGLKLAKGAMLFGKEFNDMTRDELIAAAAQGWLAEREQRERVAELRRIICYRRW